MNAWKPSAGTALVALAVAASMAAFVKTFAWPASPPVREGRTLSPREWADLTDSPRRLGNPEARVVMVVFSDFECPFCRDLQPAVRYLLDRYRDDLAVVYRHLVVTGDMAREAAVAADCALDQGVFRAMHDLIFDRGPAATSDPWSDLGRRAGVPDEAAFDSCLSARTPAGAIEADAALARRLGVDGVPTVYVAAREVTPARSLDEVERVIRAAVVRAGGGPAR